MQSRFEEGDTAWIVVSNRIIQKVYIVRPTVGFYIVKFADSDGAIQVRGSRLFATEEEAKKSVRGGKPETRNW